MRLIGEVGIETGTRQAFEIAEKILQMLQTKHSGKAQRDSGTCGGRIAHNEFESCAEVRCARLWTGLRLYLSGREVDTRFDRWHWVCGYMNLRDVVLWLAPFRVNHIG